MQFDYRSEIPAAELRAIGQALQRLQDQRNYLDGAAKGLSRFLSEAQVDDYRALVNKSGCRTERGKRSED